MLIYQRVCQTFSFPAVAASGVTTNGGQGAPIPTRRYALTARAPGGTRQNESNRGIKGALPKEKYGSEDMSPPPNLATSL
jgi:hypothetical protein